MPAPGMRRFAQGFFAFAIVWAVAVILFRILWHPWWGQGVSDAASCLAVPSAAILLWYSVAMARQVATRVSLHPASLAKLTRGQDETVAEVAEVRLIAEGTRAQVDALFAVMADLTARAGHDPADLNATMPMLRAIGGKGRKSRAG